MSDEIPASVGDGTVVVTAVAAATGETALVRVAVGSPAATLVSELGPPVGVPVVSNLLHDDGTPIPPGSTLGAAGVTDGSRVLVVGSRDHQGPADPGAPANLAAGATQEWPSEPARAPALSGGTIGRRPVHRGPSPGGHRLVAIGAAVVGAVVFVVGGLLIGRGTRTGPTAQTTPPAAVAVAASWADAVAYPGVLARGVPAGLGRAGRLTGVVEPVGSRTSGSTQDTWFVVVPTHGQAFGLAVHLVGGALAGPPAISALPFGAGALPPTAGAHRVPSPRPTATVDAWATRNFGSSGPLLSSPGIGLIGSPEVVDEWVPQAGGAVMRVQLRLSSAAPGSPASAASAAVAKARAEVVADSTTLTRDSTALGQADMALTQANASFGQADAASAAAAQALGAATAALAANPAAPPVAPDQAAATATAQTTAAAQTTVATTQAQVTAAQTLVATDQAHGKADQAAVAAARAEVPGTFTTVGRYDVWVTGNRITGWVPTGYQGG